MDSISDRVVTRLIEAACEQFGYAAVIQHLNFSNDSETYYHSIYQFDRNYIIAQLTDLLYRNLLFKKKINYII